MHRHLLTLLRPFRAEYQRFIVGVVLRQALLVLGGYSLVWALRLSLNHTGVPEWILVVAFVLFDTGCLTFDLSLNYFFSSRVSYPLFGRLRTAALEKVLSMPMEWHQKQSSGELVGKVNNGVGKVVQTAEGVSRELAPALIQTLFSLIPLLIFSASTTPLLAAALALFVWLTLQENRERKPFARRRHRNYNRDFGLFSESVEAIQPVVQYGQQQQVLSRYRGVQRQIIEQGTTEARIGIRYTFRRQLVVDIAKRVCQGIWIFQYRHNALDAATIMYLSMLTDQLMASFAGYASLLERIYDGVEPTRVLGRLMTEKPSIADDPSALPVPVPERVGIRMAGVRFSYPPRKRPVLRDFHLDIAPGTVLGIVGRSGCGKTTIQNVLTRLFEVQRGSVEICSLDIRRWPLDQLRGLFSHVTQNGGIFFSGLRIADVLRFTRPEATLREVVRAARAACIHEEDLLRNLAPWLAGRTVIIITHRLSTLRKLADEIVVLDEAGIAERGSHDDLIARDGWYAGMARLQSVA
jgi:ATP-binding cassette subfamily B protein